MIPDTRIAAVAVAKTTTGQFARNPSNANARKVEAAWRAVRDFDRVPVPRVWLHASRRGIRDSKRDPS